MAPPTPTKPAKLAIYTNNTGMASGPPSARTNLSINVDRSDTGSLAPSIAASSFWSDKKLPRLPKRKWVLGAYDNKLVSRAKSTQAHGAHKQSHNTMCCVLCVCVDVGCLRSSSWAPQLAELT